MRNRLLAVLPAALLASLILLPSSASFAAPEVDGLVTLRGMSLSEEKDTVTGATLKKAIESAPLDRAFVDQPPLVSHGVDEYPVTKEFNKCLDCHSWERARAEKATKVSQTHFTAADGKKLSSVSSRRYFCLQCHVPQVDAKPLVNNTFKGAVGQ